MAGAPERPVVLRRLGILKDPDDAVLQDPRARPKKPSEALDVFARESHASARSDARLNAVEDQDAAGTAALDLERRNPLFAVIVIAALFVVTAVWAINRLF